MESPTPEDYEDIFEHSRKGQKILDDLILRFGNLPEKSGGIDRVLNQAEYAGQRRIIDFIAMRIDQARGLKTHGETFDLEGE